jgi:hypothetical protein
LIESDPPSASLALDLGVGPVDLAEVLVSERRASPARLALFVDAAVEQLVVRGVLSLRGASVDALEGEGGVRTRDILLSKRVLDGSRRTVPTPSTRAAEEVGGRTHSFRS